jgi:hypothetical protein
MLTGVLQISISGEGLLQLGKMEFGRGQGHSVCPLSEY